MKYLVGILNNLEKMPNTTINYQMYYIRTNFFFEIVHKKEKTLKPDRLSRRKQYPGNPLPDIFENGSDNEKDDIPIFLEED